MQMRSLAAVDYVVIGSYLLVVFVTGIALTRRASRSVDQFFVGGRGLPWWLVGVSMAATNFSIDTPVSIAGFVGREGIGGVWFFWASAISAMLVTFLFARLWRRSGVITDAEIIELRYGGRPASALRLVKGLYFGVIFNAFIMGWVFLALSKVIGGVCDLDVETVLWVATALVLVYTLASGFYGVVLTDFVQYFIAIIGSVLLAVFAVREVGGLSAMVTGVSERFGSGTLDFFPGFGADSAMPLGVFLTYVLVQWWAHKYADGGGKHIQRMLSAKNENHSVAASFLFSVANYALQVWPWIVTALCALLLLGRLDDPEMGYPMMMARVLPVGVLGLVLACLVGAFMSTIDTHLNLGASYIVNDIYRRFMVKKASDRHYVLMSRLAMAVLLAVAVLLSRNIQSVGGAWKFLLTFASGAGLTWIVRWFWWRANAWTELSAMVASGAVATGLELGCPAWSYSGKLLTTVAATTVVWLGVTFATRPVEDEQLRSFVERIRPGSLGWNRIYRKYSLRTEPFLVRAIGRWLVGLAGLFALNFGVGLVLLARPLPGTGLIAVSVVALAALCRDLRSRSVAPGASAHHGAP